MLLNIPVANLSCVVQSIMSETSGHTNGASNGNTNGSSEPSLLSRMVEDLTSQAKRIFPNSELLDETIMSTLNGGIIDDSKYTVSYQFFSYAYLF